MRILLVPSRKKSKSVYLRILVDSLLRFRMAVYEYAISGLLSVFPRVNIIHLQWPDIILGLNRYYDDLRGVINKLVRFIYWFVLLLVGRVFGKKIIMTHHNAVPHKPSVSELDMKLLRKFLGLADKIIVLNNYTRSMVCRQYEELCDKIYVVKHPRLDYYYGSQIDRRTARRILGINNDTLVILSVGTFHYYKNPELFIKIAETICRKHDNVLFLIVGRQPKEFVWKLLQAVPRRCLRLINKYVPDEEIPLYISASDLALMTHKYMWASATLVLYQSYYLPVLVPKRPQFIEELGFYDGDYFYESFDDIIVKLDKLARDRKFLEVFTSKYRAKSKAVLKEREPRIVALKHLMLYLY